MKQMFLTIGHSNHALPDFLALLASHEVSAVADVRSVPSSQHRPEYNRAPLASSLSKAGIRYGFFGQALGGRPRSRELYKPNGRADYELMAKQALFAAGVSELLSLPTDRIALMCSEGNPRDCHRTLLIARDLQRRGLLVCHIERNGELTTHPQIERELVGSAGLDAELFRSDEEILNDAYQRQADRIAYLRNDVEAAQSA